jgi:hypothetical protein
VRAVSSFEKLFIIGYNNHSTGGGGNERQHKRDNAVSAAEGQACRERNHYDGIQRYEGKGV